MHGFKIGDYVIADHAEFDTFEGDTFVVAGFTTSLYGYPLVKVDRLNRPGSTMFYPRELSFEDGTRPEVQS